MRRTNNAVFPLAVGPVTTVNSPSGNITFISLSSNLCSVPFELPVILALSSTSASLGVVDVGRVPSVLEVPFVLLEKNLLSLFPFFADGSSFAFAFSFSSTSFHLKLPFSIPSPSFCPSSVVDGGWVPE